MARSREAYVDTSALIAFVDRSDSYHDISSGCLPIRRRW